MNPAFVLCFVVTIGLLLTSIVFSDKRWSWITGGLTVLGIAAMILAFGLDTAEAKSPTTLFTLSCYVEEDGYATVLVNSNAKETYSVDVGDTTIPSTFTTHKGVYALGRVGTFVTYDLVFTKDDGTPAIISITPDWQTWCDKEHTPLEGKELPMPTPEPTEEPTPEPTMAPALVSTGRICVVLYKPDNSVALACTQ